MPLVAQRIYRISAVPSGFTVQVQLLATDGTTVIASANSYSRATIQLRASAAGTHFLSVATYDSGDAGGAYADVGARDPSGAVGGEAGTWSPAEGLPGPDEHLALGNAAYRSRDFTTALEQYEEAARLDPGAPAAWFGVYMAQQALGNEAAAEAALRRAEELDPGAPLAGSARSHSVNP